MPRPRGTTRLALGPLAVAATLGARVVQSDPVIAVLIAPVTQSTPTIVSPRFQHKLQVNYSYG